MQVHKGGKYRLRGQESYYAQVEVMLEGCFIEPHGNIWAGVYVSYASGGVLGGFTCFDNGRQMTEIQSVFDLVEEITEPKVFNDTVFLYHIVKTDELFVSSDCREDLITEHVKLLGFKTITIKEGDGRSDE